jgi:hypothetical protein
MERWLTIFKCMSKHLEVYWYLKLVLKWLYRHKISDVGFWLYGSPNHCPCCNRVLIIQISGYNKDLHRVANRATMSTT